MQLESIEGHVITLRGNIKTVGDYQELKGHINKVVDSGSEELAIIFRDSSTITSSVIGHLFKVMNMNKVKISLEARNERLYKTLSDLCLIDMFNVTHGE